MRKAVFTTRGEQWVDAQSQWIVFILLVGAHCTLDLFQALGLAGCQQFFRFLGPGSMIKIH